MNLAEFLAAMETAVNAYRSELREATKRFDDAQNEIVRSFLGMNGDDEKPMLESRVNVSRR